MRATDDVACREAAFAARNPALPDGIATPTLGVAHDGSERAILMRDITPSLLPQGFVPDRDVNAILARMAALHSASPPDRMPWCDLRLRLTLLTPERARIAAEYGAPVAADLTAGWQAFTRHATAGARRVVESLHADPSPLLRALSREPAAFLHGDLKFDNIGLDADGTMLLLDWAMPVVAPPAVELGWFLAINSRRTMLSLDAALGIYADAARLSGNARARHDALAAVCGLVLRGWRKALDADEGEPEELRWWCDRVEAAEPLLR